MGNESSIVLPVVVEDRAALAELKKIQKELGNAGVESAKLNKQIEDAMKNMAAKTAKAYGDMGMSLQGLKNKWTEFSSAINVAQQAFGWAKQAVDLAKYSAEFSRLERAVPVERMRALQAETGGTVSKFDLLKRAAKEMGLSATAGLDEASKRMQQTLATWENTVNSIKAGLGSIAMTAIDWLDRLSDSIAGVETIRTREDQARANAKRNIIDRRAQDPQGSFIANAARNVVDEDSPEYLAELARQRTWLIKNSAMGDAQRQRQLVNDTIATRAEKSGGWAGLLKPSGGGAPSVGDLWRAGQLWNMDHEHEGTWSLFSPSDSAVPSLGSAYGDLVLWNAKNRINRKRKPRKQFDIGGLSGPGLDALEGLGSGPGDGELNDVQSYGLGFEGWAAPTGLSFADRAKGALGDLRGGLNHKLRNDADSLKTFNEQLRDQTSAVGAAYSTLSAGITAGVEAAIAGSDNIGKAALKAAQTQLKAIAIQSTVQALYSTALGLFGDPTKFAAAAKFAATAVAAGVGSAALGSMVGSGGGASASMPTGGPSASAGNVTGGSSRQDGSAQNVTINMYGTIAAGSKREVGESLVSATDLARRAGRVRSEQSTTVRFE